MEAPTSKLHPFAGMLCHFYEEVLIAVGTGTYVVG